jgi:uncharacterized membrane protein
MDDASATTTIVADPRNESYAHLMYALHAFAVVTGILTAASIVGQFVFGLPSIIAVIMNYARRNQVRGTWLATHFSWQLRTFWWAFGWVAGIWLTFGPLALLLIGIPFMILGYLLVGVWVAYRVARGWLALRDGRAMPIIR